MLPLRHSKQWQIASLLFLIFVLAAALMPAFWDWDNKVQMFRWFSRLDLWLHGAVFAALSLWFAGLYARQSYWRVAIGLLLFGIAIELCQRAVGYRSADLADVLADAGGIALGLTIALLGGGQWCLWVEDQLARRKPSVNG